LTISIGCNFTTNPGASVIFREPFCRFCLQKPTLQQSPRTPVPLRPLPTRARKPRLEDVGVDPGIPSAHTRAEAAHSQYFWHTILKGYNCINNEKCYLAVPRSVWYTSLSALICGGCASQGYRTARGTSCLAHGCAPLIAACLW